MRVAPDVISQLPTRYPLGHELGGFKGNTLEEHNIRMCEVFPDHGLLAKCLQSWLGRDILAEYLIEYPFYHRPTVFGGNPKLFDANVCGTEGPFKSVTKPSKRNRRPGTD